MDYNFREIEKKWQQRWVENGTYRVTEDKQKEKFYVLNMFPYPSGAGLHVGHPLGYIASDIYARYKRQKGFNVLNPMGYDAYGLPAEQYAIQTGQHPAITTEQNINRYREQLDKIGFSFDWSREVRTCEPGYYHWTQWAFQKMFKSFYSLTPLTPSPKGEGETPKARPIAELVAYFEKHGTEGLEAFGVAQSEELQFTADEWNSWSEQKQQEVLMNYRLAYLGETMVNWCAELGTVLANDEVVDGVSVRGGYPVVQKKMRQWCLRVSAYAQRLLDGLDTIDWTDSLKETQRNWIGRSEGTEMQFKVADSDVPEDPPPGGGFTIFTTRADTIFGVTFMVLAPESELVEQLTTPEQQAGRRRIPGLREEAHRARAPDGPPRDGRVLGLLCHQPLHGREDTHLDCRIRAGWLRHRCHHGCAGPRLARLCLRQALQSAHRPAHRGCRHLGRELRRQGGHRDEQLVGGDDARLLAQRPQREGSHRRHQEVRHGAPAGPREGELPPARRHLLAPALLGRAVPRLL